MNRPVTWADFASPLLDDDGEDDEPTLVRERYDSSVAFQDLVEYTSEVRLRAEACVDSIARKRSRE